MGLFHSQGCTRGTKIIETRLPGLSVSAETDLKDFLLSDKCVHMSLVCTQIQSHPKAEACPFTKSNIC